MPRLEREAVSGFYDRIFRFYEKANVLLTFGLVKAWRRAAARIAVSGECGKCLDVCCGTGEFSRALRKENSAIEITGIDFNEKMLEVARESCMGARFLKADAENLPFENESFDIAVMGFAARNLETEGILGRTINEIHRILKPGGKFVNLETNVPENPVVRFFFNIFNRSVFMFISLLKPDTSHAYAYLEKSIRGFSSARDLISLLSKAGFSDITFKSLFCSSAMIVCARKN